MSAYDENEWHEDGDAYDSDPDGLVHPMPKLQVEQVVDGDDPSDGREQGADDKKCESELQGPERSPTMSHIFGDIPEVTKSHHLGRVGSVLSATTGSDDASSECSDERDKVQQAPKYAEEVVRRHARRVNMGSSLPRPIPPPAPVTVEIADIGVEASIEAQKRVSEYRRRKAQQEDDQKNRNARDAQNAKQVRMMYKEFNRTTGVADIAPDARYKNALNAKRREKQRSDQAAAAEPATRWYRKVVRKTRSGYNAADFCAKILEDARREHHAKLREKELHRKAINKKLKQLNLEAKAIIAESAGVYERGSFLLKVTPHKSIKSEPTQKKDAVLEST